MRLLGAIIAGGASRRFGSDKAAAPLSGRAMIDHVADALRPQIDALVVCGRAWGDLGVLIDRPGGRIGPLGGLNAALHHAAAHGFAAVLCAPVDTLPLPDDVALRLGGEGAAVFDKQYSIGYWPASLAPLLDAYIADGGRSWRGWIEQARARLVAEPAGIRNINVPDQLPEEQA